MCQYCEGKKVIFYKNRHKETDLDRDEIEISINNVFLKVYLFKSHYDPNELDFDGDWGKFITDHKITRNVPIKYCPMCGRDLNQPKPKGMKNIQIKSLQVNRLIGLLEKGLAYDDAHYRDNVTKADQNLIDQIKQQLQNKRK